MIVNLKTGGAEIPLPEEATPAPVLDAGARSNWPCRVYKVDPLSDPRWSEFLARNEEASLFHSPGWLRALHKTYGYSPVAYTTTPPGEPIADGLVVCCVESYLTGKRLVSLPFSDFCQPLASSPEGLAKLLAYIEQETRREGWNYFEGRPLSPLPVYGANWCVSETYLHHRIDLRPDVELLFSNLHRDSIQRKIRRAEREGLEYIEGTTEELLTPFYKLMVQTRRRHGVPPQPKRWYRALLECLGDAIQIRIARNGNTPVAGMLTIRYKNSLIYKYGGSDTRFNKFGGMHLLYWKSIQDAKRLGLQSFDLGRTDLHQSGLITFKRRWGASESKINYVRYGDSNQRTHAFEWSWKSRTMRFAVSHLPKSVLPVLGDVLYRHCG
ncbi:MAG TPA: GNAT family N-acetyltransferase [Verrucomicrobiae bacterium]|nr:GNAT family N-acetyltransferase [Verrucomicrobiae bacterium]